MWKDIALFEWQYRRQRPATYLYFALLFVISFLLVTTDVIEQAAGGQLKQNATSVITQLMGILSVVSVFVASAIMGVAIVRDFEHRTEALFFTAPIRKADYLLGRFLGSFLVLSLILTAIPLALMLGELMPWRDADKLLPFRAAIYWWPFLVLVLPNAFIVGALFFMVGALSRRMLVVFMQGIILFLLFQVSNQLLGQLDKRELAALLDPFGIRAFGYVSRYWSMAEQNHQLLPLAGMEWQNRLLWLSVAGVALVLTYVFFSFNQVRQAVFTRKPAKTESVTPGSLGRLPRVSLSFSPLGQLRSVLSMTGLYFRSIVRDLPFLGLISCGLILFVYTALTTKGSYGTHLAATTSYMLKSLNWVTGVFGLILMVMYVGNLLWIERDRHFNLIHDALPIPSAAVLVGKYFGLVLAFAVAFGVAIGVGVLLQLIKGADFIDWPLYVTSVYGDTLLNLMIFMLLGFFVHTLVNNKMAGHGIMIGFIFSLGLLSYLGIEHALLLFDSASLGPFSEMNRYGHFITPFSWLNVYWLALAVLLFGLAVLVSARGAEDLLKLRLRVGQYRLTKPLLTLMLTTTVLFVSSGAYVYYNTNVLNHYQNSKEVEHEQAQYEVLLKADKAAPQPRITDVAMHVDLRPETRSFSASGTYVLKNKTNQPIRIVSVQGYPDEAISYQYIRFNRPAMVNNRFASRFQYRTYQLGQPLQPGDSLTLQFAMTYAPKGFTNDQRSTDVVYNGTFFNNRYFPHIGYADYMELADDDKRKKQGLPPRERMRERTDPVGLHRGATASDADFVRFAMTVSTIPDQEAFAPGYLQKTWLANDAAGHPRRYFQYKMETPMPNFYSVVSASYAVRQEVYTGSPGKEQSSGPVSLAVYYHPTHGRNVGRMMRAMRASLDYYQANFGPYQARQLRIMEFPYRSFAQSFANTVPFSENIGFVQEINDAKDIDLPFFVAAHEIAHQWWGHQVEEADVKGGAMLSESLAEYSALMVMSKQYPKERMQEFLAYELDRYLTGRAGENKKEQPLTQVEGQQYIHYAKGSHVLYALQDQIGEATLNRALRNYLDKWNLYQIEKTGIYPTSTDLITEIRAVTPDTLQHLVTDYLETITLYDNRTEQVTVKPQGNQFAVTIKYSAQKLQADSLGNEKPLPLNDWVWVGVYAKEQGSDKDKLIYYQRHKLTRPKESLTVLVSQKPSKAGIDPLNILVDRHTQDNVEAVN